MQKFINILYFNWVYSFVFISWLERNYLQEMHKYRCKWVTNPVVKSDNIENEWHKMNCKNVRSNHKVINVIVQKSMFEKGVQLDIFEKFNLISVFSSYFDWNIIFFSKALKSNEINLLLSQHFLEAAQKYPIMTNFQNTKNRRSKKNRHVEKWQVAAKSAQKVNSFKYAKQSQDQIVCKDTIFAYKNCSKKGDESVGKCERKKNQILQIKADNCWRWLYSSLEKDFI